MPPCSTPVTGTYCVPIERIAFRLHCQYRTLPPTWHLLYAASRGSAAKGFALFHPRAPTVQPSSAP